MTVERTLVEFALGVFLVNVHLQTLFFGGPQMGGPINGQLLAWI
jgi:hypothetical protein